jgi:sugar lactone lactonase YvrE
VPPTLAIESARIFYDGIADHSFRNPEGIALGPDGSIWCGTSTGWVYRIAPDGSSAEQVASTGGFLLGIAFDRNGSLYVCDLLKATVLRLPPGGDAFVPFASPGEGAIRIPNVVVVDDDRGVVYVSDSHGDHDPGPGVWRFDLATGEGGLWYAGALDFANGMTLSADRTAILVAESWGRRVTRIGIGEDGSAQDAEVLLTVGDDVVIDGLTIDDGGDLLLLCYTPSCVYRYRPGRDLELIINDPDHSILCHPTNGVIRDGVLFTANLGRWHITQVPLA